MILEYMICDPGSVDSIKEYNLPDVEKSIYQIEDSNSWIVRFDIPGMNVSNARRMSKINDSFVTEYDVYTLENGPAAYYNQHLYPLINSFERKLRKLLHVVAATSKDKDTSQKFDKIEEMDFGELFSLLFVDLEFMHKIKDVVKKQNQDSFTKREIIEIIENVDENSVWKAILGSEAVPTLQNNFNMMRTYRNDVMHSHNIGWSTYSSAKQIYTKVNDELDTSILKATAGAKHQNTQSQVSLSAAIDAIGKIAAAQSAIIETIKECMESTPFIQHDGLPQIKDVVGGVPQSALQAFSAQIADIERAIAPSQSLSDSFKVIQNAITPLQIEYDESIKSLQRALGNLNIKNDNSCVAENS